MSERDRLAEALMRLCPDPRRCEVEAARLRAFAAALATTRTVAPGRPRDQRTTRLVVELAGAFVDLTGEAPSVSRSADRRRHGAWLDLVAAALPELGGRPPATTAAERVAEVARCTK